MEGCTFHFFTHAALKKHVENVHQALAFVCHYCQKRYKHQSTLKEHLNTHKEHKGFLCDICGRGFKTKDLCTSSSHVFYEFCNYESTNFFHEFYLITFLRGRIFWLGSNYRNKSEENFVRKIYRFVDSGFVKTCDELVLDLLHRQRSPLRYLLPHIETHHTHLWRLKPSGLTHHVW